jgi:uncharacterized protein
MRRGRSPAFNTGASLVRGRRPEPADFSGAGAGTVDSSSFPRTAAPVETHAMLEMRTTCERCGTHLSEGGEARICSFECTFCAGCAAAMDATCPNCAGELVDRPRRVAAT